MSTNFGCSAWTKKIHNFYFDKFSDVFTYKFNNADPDVMSKSLKQQTVAAIKKNFYKICIKKVILNCFLFKLNKNCQRGWFSKKLVHFNKEKQVKNSLTFRWKKNCRLLFLIKLKDLGYKSTRNRLRCFCLNLVRTANVIIF